MKTRTTILTLSGLFVILIFLLSGCYTQLGSLRNEKDNDEEYTTSAQSSDTSYISEDEEYGNSGCCDEYYRPHVGFTYYYPSSYWPSVAFGIAYADPWFYDYGWGYNPWYYSTAWNPYYGYYPYSYYSPFSPWYYGGYYYGYPGYSVYNGKRDVGEVRAVGRNDDGNGRIYDLQGPSNLNLPSGASLGSAPASSAPPNRQPSGTKVNQRNSGSNRYYIPHESRGRTGNSVNTTSRSSGRGERRRDTQPQYRPHESNNPQAPTYNPPPRETRNSTPSYTPPPPPPQSSSGTNRSGNERNSGESRGRRP